MIGYFGPDIIFETSDERILSFSGFTRDAAGRWGSHDLIGIKPKSEFIGPGLDTISFTVSLNGNNGVKPREQMDKWLEYTRKGVAETLVIGGKPLGVDKWAVKSVSEVWNTVFKDGELFSGTIEVSLEEYVSN
jgi:phage protein U